ncbi:hypothetical protein CRUP_025288, partial [Coryphaenoides rupestris]
CPYLHRTTGDTERKYHLRYYKTGTCIHETDARGHCVKNGLHCAFAHGPHDLRPPVYDIRELQAQEALQNGQLGSGEGIPDLQPGVLASQAMIEKTLTEDPRWHDTNFVLANYKTEQCTKPPRLCRQGYACPHYHNSRDRRRNPRKYKYRSTPCPNVKHGDEWGEPSKCDSGDGCQYCHSRTEQQFHPEIYKSTKCNDMRQTGYCPRGPFCAFAHVERIPSAEETMSSLLSAIQSGSQAQQYSECPISEWNSGGNSASTPAGGGGGSSNGHQIKNKGDQKLMDQDKQVLASSVGSDSSSPTTLSTMNAKATPFYPGSNTVDDINVASLERELEEQEDNVGFASQRLLAGSAPVNIPGSLARSSSFNSSSSLSTSPLSSLSQSLSQSLLGGVVSQTAPPPASLLAKQEHGLLGTPSSSSQNSLGLNGANSSIWDFVSGSFSPSPSPVFSSLASGSGGVAGGGGGGGGGDLSRLFRELDEAKRKLKQWEQAWSQVKQACESCQKESLEAKERVQAAEAERRRAEQQTEEAERRLQELQGDFDALCRAPGAAALLRGHGDLELLPLGKLRSIQGQLRSDLELLDGVIYQLQSKKCVVCQKHERSVVLQPCQHYVLCGSCAPSKTECPYCRTKILKW